MTPELQVAINHFNRGDYLESQVTFETALGNLSEEEKPLAQALLMLAGAMHLYFNRGGGRGTFNLMRQSLVKLDDFRPERWGIAVDELYEAVSAYLEDLQSRTSRHPRFIDRWLVPHIRVKR